MSEKLEPSFVLLIDPPKVDWWRSSEGFLYTLKEIVTDLKRVDPHEQSEIDIHGRLTSIITALSLITDSLVERQDDGRPCNINEGVARLLDQARIDI